NCIGMMPGVPRFIVRRRRQAPCWQTLTPVGPALQILAMAGCAVVAINTPPNIDQLSVGRINPVTTAAIAWPPGIGHEHKQREDGCGQRDSECCLAQRTTPG